MITHYLILDKESGTYALAKGEREHTQALSYGFVDADSDEDWDAYNAQSRSFGSYLT